MASSSLPIVTISAGGQNGLPNGVVYQAGTVIHDVCFGSKDLTKREYYQYLQEAKVIGDSLRYPGSKISWSPGKTPSFEIGSWYQGITRMVKNKLPGFVANGSKCSTNAIEWSIALRDSSFKLNELDQRIFIQTQRAFAEQARLYREDFKNSKKELDRDISNNYADAASLLGQFIYKDKVDEVVRDLSQMESSLQAQDFQTYLNLKIKGLQNQDWVRSITHPIALLQNDNNYLLTQRERLLLGYIQRSQVQPLLIQAGSAEDASFVEVQRQGI